MEVVVGVDRGLDGQSCHAATSLTAQSAGSAPRVPAFRWPGAAGGPPGHPAHHPGGWLRADQVPVRRHRVGHWADTPAEIMPSRGWSCSPLGRAERENGHLTIRSVQPGARVTRAQSAGRSRFTGPIAERDRRLQASARLHIWQIHHGIDQARPPARGDMPRRLAARIRPGRTRSAGRGSAPR